MAVTVRHTPTVVVGTGIAGLSVALNVGRCTVVTNGAVRSGSSELAQGGIAASLDPGDTADRHRADTLRVSGGIADPIVADAVTAAAAGRIEWLIGLGARFDRDDSGRLVLGREAGHSDRRIVHSNGDATGTEVMRALRGAVAERPDIEVLEDLELVDLITDGDDVSGILVLLPDGELIAILADAVVLATGGIGRLYARTTNPQEVAGDGLAVAARAGAMLADLEFVQFHPTTLAVDADPAPLLTEALRGEGAVLIDDEGHRFMTDLHPDAELAPRDVVARGIWRQLEGGRKVLLDATDAVGPAFPTRFPTAWQCARAAGLDPRHDPLPVAPAEHFHMGGVATDGEGATTLRGLWAVGEVASTGLHGANRLASNSLLEGLAIGARAAQAIVAARPRSARRSPDVPAAALQVVPGEDAEAVHTVRNAMWDGVGVERSAAGISATQRILRTVSRPSHVRNRNLPTIGSLIAAAAASRTESRGGHYRSDHPYPAKAGAVRSFITPERSDRVALP